jgi:hypothetical protein
LIHFFALDKNKSILIQQIIYITPIIRTKIFSILRLFQTKFLKERLLENSKAMRKRNMNIILAFKMQDSLEKLSIHWKFFTFFHIFSFQFQFLDFNFSFSA